MPRTMLTDKRWEKLLQIMKNTGRVYNKSEHRMTFEGILFRMRTGIPWRDLPEEFGGWSTVYRRFNLWSKKGILVDIFKHLSQLADSEPFRCFVRQKGGRTVIAKRNYGKDIDKSSMDRCLYRYRHLVENAFARIKQYRSISTRYDKLERNYASMVSLAFMLMWLPMYC
ncbi:transposase [Gilliamella sp. BG6]|uniref:transposase n=1 Tax=unclassified Gilliamella TaxID=2685620 RepID=UPI00398710EA